jgi:hypothetical protein
MTKVTQLTIEQIKDYLNNQRLAHGSVQGVMLHNTAIPDHSDGIKTVVNIGNAQVSAGRASDIMANFYTDKDFVYTARKLVSPNWAHGYVEKRWAEVPSDLRILCNNDRLWPNKYLIGIETIGNFDNQEPIMSGSMGTSVKLIVEILKFYDLGTNRIFFHRDVHKTKTCPGSKVTKEYIKEAVEKEMGYKEEFTGKIVLKNNGKVINCQSINRDGAVFVGLRSFVEKLGGKVDYDPKTGVIEIELKVI